MTAVTSIFQICIVRYTAVVKPVFAKLTLNHDGSIINVPANAVYALILGVVFRCLSGDVRVTRHDFTEKNLLITFFDCESWKHFK